MIASITRNIKSNFILRSSIALAFITIAAKFLGYIEKLLLAYYFGTNYQVDVYNIVVAIILSVFIFFRELVEPSFLNIFLKAIKKKNEEAAWSLFSLFFRYILLISFALTLVVYFSPQKVIVLFAPGFGKQQKELASQLIQLAFPASIFLSLSALTNITLNGLKKFALPASGELIYKIFILLALCSLYRSFGIFAAVIGFLVGALFKLLIPLGNLFFKISFKSYKEKSDLLETWNLSWPLLIGVSFSQISTLLDNVFASYMKEGAISALSYSKKLIELPILLFPYVLSVVVFPYLSELSIIKEREKMIALLSQCIYWIVAIFLPLSLFLFVFSHQIVELIFQRGAFNEYSTMLTAKPLEIYCCGMVFFAVETVLVIFYYASSDTKTPIFVGLACAIGNIIATYLLIPFFGYLAVPMALVLSKAVKNIILVFLLNKKFSLELPPILLFLGKVGGASLITCLLLLFFKWLMVSSNMPTTLARAGLLAIAFFLSASTYVLLILFFRGGKNLSFYKGL